MSLTTELSTVEENFRKNAPDTFKQPIMKAREEFQNSFKPAAAIQVGDTLPEFTLPDALGKDISSGDLLRKGRPLLISFYRGEWCPFCNLALRAWQKHFHELEANGVTLVAISPELPDQSLTTVEKNELKFAILSDVGNKFARKLGILYAQPDYLRQTFEKLGHDLKRRNGDDSFEVPVPATLLVDEKGVVRNTFVNPDYTKRLEPSVAMEWIDALRLEK